MSPEKKAEYLDAIRRGVSLREACGVLGVSRRTIQRWRDADPDFNEEVLQAMERADDEVEDRVYQLCTDENPANNTLRIFWLKSRRPEVYNRAEKHEISGPDGKPAVVLYLPTNGRESQPESD